MSNFQKEAKRKLESPIYKGYLKKQCDGRTQEPYACDIVANFLGLVLIIEKRINNQTCWLAKVFVPMISLLICLRFYFN